jgi:hypothetical protein
MFCRGVKLSLEQRKLRKEKGLLNDQVHMKGQSVKSLLIVKCHEEGCLESTSSRVPCQIQRMGSFEEERIRTAHGGCSGWL